MKNILAITIELNGVILWKIVYLPTPMYGT